MLISLTDMAAKRVLTLLKKRVTGDFLRISVKNSGCSGMTYVLKLTDIMNDDDTVLEDKGVKIIVDSQSLVYLNGTELDFVKHGLNEGFKFNNPNSKHECGCGASFNI